MTDAPHAVSPATDVRAFFREQLDGAMARQGVGVKDETGAYLVNLLAEFLNSDQLFVREADGTVDREPLAFLLRRAVDAPRAQRAALLRRLGDTALYVSGFFADSLAHGLVDVDYYAEMGGRAYGVLGDSVPARPAASVFHELAEKFLRVTDLFGEISERTAIHTDTGLVRLYDRYVKTGSERLRRLLADSGVPAPVTR